MDKNDSFKESKLSIFTCSDMLKENTSAKKYVKSQYLGAPATIYTEGDILDMELDNNILDGTPNKD